MFPLRPRDCVHVLIVLLAAVAPVAAHTRRPPPTPEEIAWSRSATQIRAVLKTIRDAPPALPPAPAGVTDIAFTDLFAPTVGPRGLEYSDRIRALDGQRVRIVGYMVKQARRYPGIFLFAPLPVSTDEIEYGFCDELPPSTLHVLAADHPDRLVPLQAGRCVLIGRLELGSHPEADGRNSVARLHLDPEPPAPAPAVASASSP